MTVFDHLPLGHILFSLTFVSGYVTRHLPSAFTDDVYRYFLLFCYQRLDIYLSFFLSQYQFVWGNLTRRLPIFSAYYYRELCEVIKTSLLVTIVSNALLWTDYLINVRIAGDDEICLSSQFSVSLVMNVRRHYLFWSAAIYHTMISSFTNKKGDCLQLNFLKQCEPNLL